MIIYEMDGRRVGTSEMHIEGVTRVISQWSETPSPQAPESECRLSAQQHQERFVRLRDEALQTQGRIRAHWAALATPGSEEAAEASVRTLIREAGERERQAQAGFWQQIPGIECPPGFHFVPYWKTKTFSAADCSAHDSEAAGRRWYCALCEKFEMEEKIISARGKGHSWRKVLKAVLTILEQGEDADAAWDRYATLSRMATRRSGHRRAGAEAPMDFLTAWTTTRISAPRLLPAVIRSGARANREGYRNGLLLEACGIAHSLKPDSLPVPRFRELPRTVASGMGKMYREPKDVAIDDVGEVMDRLKPDAQRRRLLLSGAEPAPEDAVLEREGVAMIHATIARLPPKQQQAILLSSEGLTYEEIAAQLGCKMESVKTHLKRARRSLRLWLGQEPGFESE